MATAYAVASAVPLPPVAPLVQATAVPSPAIQSTGPAIDADGMKQYLKGKGFTDGLISAAIKSSAMFPLRFFIVDDSGSMSANDGHRLIGEGAKTKSVFACYLHHV
jgi:hypothetical protein